ncbi:MAG: hypothetical protein P4M15_03495 [Alphaproteobacteria bacterium]|nr:hypothetical protein [Alphaproteobacteria bacterium]
MTFSLNDAPQSFEKFCSESGSLATISLQKDGNASGIGLPQNAQARKTAISDLLNSVSPNMPMPAKMQPFAAHNAVGGGPAPITAAETEAASLGADPYALDLKKMAAEKAARAKAPHAPHSSHHNPNNAAANRGGAARPAAAAGERPGALPYNAGRLQQIALRL